MRRPFAMLAVFMVLSFASFAQQPSPQPSSQSQPQSSPEPQTPDKVQPGSPGVIGGIIAVSPEEVLKSGFGIMNVSCKLKKDGTLGELHPYYQDPASQRFATQEHPELEQKVLENMRQWKFSPFLLEGRPVEIGTIVVLAFNFQNPASSLQLSLNAASPSSYTGETKLPGSLFQWLELDQEAMDSLRVRYKAAAYPGMASLAHIQGDVVIRIRVDKEGRVAEEKAMSGHPILIQSALDAVKKWQYRPVVVNGQPVEVRSTVVIRFHM